MIVPPFFIMESFHIPGLEYCKPNILLESNELSIKDDITSGRREYLLKKWGPISSSEEHK